MNENYFDDGIKTAEQVTKQSIEFNKQLNIFIEKILFASYEYQNMLSHNDTKRLYKYSVDYFEIRSSESILTDKNYVLRIRHRMLGEKKNKVLLKILYGKKIDRWGNSSRYIIIKKIYSIDTDRLDYLKSLLDIMLAKIEAMTMEIN